jgi:hypothetical protein
MVFGGKIIGRLVGARRENQRRVPRRKSGTTGYVRLGSFAKRACTVRDISVIGVRLNVPSAEEIPAVFEFLAAAGGSARRARIVWRRGNEIGAEFIDEDDPI